MMKVRFPVVLAVLVFALAAGAAFGQAYPSKPVKLITTYPPGGSSDLMGRILAQKLTELWGQQVITENRAGAAGSIGMDYAAKQPADGYTFVIGNLQPVSVNPVMSKVPYDINRDFAPVSMLCVGPNILVVNANSPWKTLGELVAAAKAKPGAINFGTSGPGSMSHLAAELFKRQAAIDMTAVQYKGGVLAVQDLLGGQVQMIVSDALPVMQHIRAGKLRALAITSEKRSPLSPEIPTFAEGGVPGIVAVNWWGVLVPAGTPRPIVDKMNADIAKVLANADLRQKYADLGVEPLASTPEEFRSHIQTEMTRWAKVVKDANIKSE